MRKDGLHEGGAGPEGVKGHREEAGVGTQDREVEVLTEEEGRVRGGTEDGPETVRNT